LHGSAIAVLGGLEERKQEQRYDADDEVSPVQEMIVAGDIGRDAS
jgi:hypothetical protein